MGDTPRAAEGSPTPTDTPTPAPADNRPAAPADNRPAAPGDSRTGANGAGASSSEIVAFLRNRESSADSADAPKGPDRPVISDDVMNHTLYGEIKRGSGKGWHHSPDGVPPPGRSLAPDATVESLHNDADPTSEGVYVAGPLSFDAGDGSPPATKPRSTFFPDSWSDAQTRETVQGAWNDPGGTRNHDNSIWTGEHQGFKVTGYFQTSDDSMATAFPNY